MARLGIEDLPKPARFYRVQHEEPPPPNRFGKEHKPFESNFFCEAEDAERAHSCPRSQSPLFSPKSAKKLGRKLSRRRRPKTLASSRSWRRFRIRVVGGLWKLIGEGPWGHRVKGQVSVFSLAPRCWEFTPAQLSKIEARLLMAQLRTWLNRRGAEAADGFLIACIHGEWVDGLGYYRVHVHGVATGGMIAVLDELRKNSEFASGRDRSGLAKPPARIVLSRKPIEHLAYALSYQFKGYWLSRWIGPVGPLGEIKRARQGQRMAEPHHTELLLWLDSQRLQDITLLMNLRVGKQGFVLTQKVSDGDRNDDQ